MHPNGYYFSRPIYMHKFTSRDVQTNQGYVEKATEIEVQPSHSYEIKPETYQQSESKNYQQHVFEDPVPVIVLRVPGPSKYALHLQALLQQYLELRAAQFLKVLEEQDRHGHLMSPQHYVPQQEQVAYIPMITMYPTQQTYYHQQTQQVHQQPQQHDYRQQQQQYYHHRQQQQQQQQSLYHQQQSFHHRVPVGQQSYYRQPQIYHNPQRPQMQYQKYVQQPQHYQPAPVHQSTIVTYVTPAYSEEDREPLQTSENYPSDKHTHVIFKKKKNQRIQAHHPQPSITYHTDEPIVVPDEASVAVPYAQPEPEEVYVSHAEYPVTHQPTYTNHHQEHQEVQKLPAPVRESVTKAAFNYHVASTLAPTYEELHERHNPKRMAPFSKEQFEKAKRMMEKSRRNRGTVKADLSQIKEEKSDKKST